MISSFEEMKDIAQSSDNGKKIQIIDARPHGRWTGKDPEPRLGSYNTASTNGHVDTRTKKYISNRSFIWACPQLNQPPIQQPG